MQVTFPQYQCTKMEPTLVACACAPSQPTHPDATGRATAEGGGGV